MQFSKLTKKYFNSLFLIFLFAVFSTQIRAEIVVVTHPDSEFSHLSKEMVHAYFLGELLTTNTGATVAIGMQVPTTAIRQEFDSQILEIESEKLLSRWSGLVFSGHASMPEVLKNDKEVIEWLLKQVNAIAYIDKENLTEELKLLYLHSP